MKFIFIYLLVGLIFGITRANQAIRYRAIKDAEIAEVLKILDGAYKGKNIFNIFKRMFLYIKIGFIGIKAMRPFTYIAILFWPVENLCTIIAMIRFKTNDYNDICYYVDNMMRIPESEDESK